MTSAFMGLQLYLGQSFNFKVIPFDKILETVSAGEADAGLVIHEGQLTFEAHGLIKLLDLGLWWAERTSGLPLPLGGNVVRKDLGPGVMSDLTRILKDSIEFGLDNRPEALEYAEKFGRGLDRGLADRFVGMYVNDLTRDYGDRGRTAIKRFLEEGHKAGLIPRLGEIEFVE
jgi:1,4-dihydroxy-6-naphthoate synthase